MRRQNTIILLTDKFDGSVGVTFFYLKIKEGQESADSLPLSGVDLEFGREQDFVAG